MGFSNRKLNCEWLPVVTTTLRNIAIKSDQSFGQLLHSNNCNYRLTGVNQTAVSVIVYP